MYQQIVNVRVSVSLFDILVGCFRVNLNYRCSVDEKKSWNDVLKARVERDGVAKFELSHLRLDEGVKLTVEHINESGSICEMQVDGSCSIRESLAG